MGQNKFTPEERLLKIIEGKYTSSKSLERDVKKQKARIGKKRFFSSLKNIQLADLMPQGSTVTLRLVNNILITVAIVFAGVFVFGFIRDKINIKRNFALVTGVPELIEDKKIQPLISKANFAAVLKEARKRNVFTLAPQAKEEKRKTAIKPRERVADLKLVGILWSSNPQAMIEDVKSGRTYLIGAGDEIKRWKVKAIYQDRVIIVGDEGESELR